MENLSIKEILEATGGILICGDVDFAIGSISTDSRDISEDCLFVPLIGENFDGHDFIKASFDKGAKAVITGRNIDIDNHDKIIIKVENTLKAYQDIAKYYRSKFNIPFIAITGSVGKTTTKDMIACVLSQKYKVLKTEGNFNNEIGLPKTIFNFDRSFEIGVIEMGMSSFGEIDRLTNIVHPNTAVITNIGVSHIEKLGSRENILKAKLEIINSMDEASNLVLNADDDLLSELKGIPFKNIYYYSINSKKGIYAINIENNEQSSKFTVIIDNNQYNVEIPVLGEHNILNSLAAIRIGLIYNVPIVNIIDGLNNFISGKMRQNIIKLDYYTIIEDCYNASPNSMKAALKVLNDLKGSRKIAVLADMLEMGEYSEKYHKEVGEFAAKNGVDYLFLFGDYKGYTANGAKVGGMKSDSIFLFDNKEDLSNKLKQFIQKDDIILIKGSRGMKMEEVIRDLREVN